ncbi:MAG: hypothetical protein ACLFVS_02165 [Candidatus Acetothermia bacterium]
MARLEQKRVEDEDLFELAFDCTQMITSLGKSIEYKSSGEDDAATGELKRVEELISRWVQEVEGITDKEGVDKKKLLSHLEGAKYSLEKAEEVLSLRL